MDSFKIDSHKLYYHVPRIYDWLKGKNIYPIYIEVGIYSGCNHRCSFCAFDFLQYSANSLQLDYFKKFINTVVKKGVKSILFAGEGEPLLHRDVIEVVSFTKSKGIDVALATNGVMLTKDKLQELLSNLTWLKVSLDAATRKIYSYIHGAKEKDFDTVISNLKEAVKIRNKSKYKCAIGSQFLLIPSNYKETVNFVRLMRDIKVDYAVIKPYSHHPSSKNIIDQNFDYKKTIFLEKQLEKYSSDSFQVIFRRRTMEGFNKKKTYKHCYGLHFATHITANGDVYPCNFFVGKKEFSFGNICQESFSQIWEGAKRRKIMARINSKQDMNACRCNCRLDKINQYLWELKNPSQHVNFI
ncbi:MAG: radical SAM protein [Candidatus Omnitrophica bacterium]|nr:radical SAM protein [Candidatus Omnitrophota bacterium]